MRLCSVLRLTAERPLPIGWRLQVSVPARNVGHISPEGGDGELLETHNQKPHQNKSSHQQ